jgi:hypothetical protein
LSPPVSFLLRAVDVEPVPAPGEIMGMPMSVG